MNTLRVRQDLGGDKQPIPHGGTALYGNDRCKPNESSLSSHYAGSYTGSSRTMRLNWAPLAFGATLRSFPTSQESSCNNAIFWSLEDMTY